VEFEVPILYGKTKKEALAILEEGRQDFEERRSDKGRM
jgi:hypothetical protein